MAVGFGILIPIGVLVARTLKPLDPLWFHLHRVIQANSPPPLRLTHGCQTCIALLPYPLPCAVYRMMVPSEVSVALLMFSCNTYVLT